MLRSHPVTIAAIGSFLVVAVALSLTCDQPPLSAVLFALPLLIPAAFPLSWWSWPWSWGITAFVASAAAHPAIVLAGVEASRASGQIAWASTLAKAWMLMGLGLCLFGLIARAWRRWPRWKPRLAAALLIPAMYPLLAGPMELVYRPQVTYRTEEYPEGRRWRVRGDGVELDTLLLPSLASGPTRGVLMFVHGVGRWKEFYRRDVTFLRTLGWDVLCFDLRGHGRSSMAPCTYGLREVGDLVAEWTEAKRLAGGRPLAAYGVSLGGAILLQGAHRLDGCSAVIVESPFGDLGPLVGKNLRPPALWVGMAVCQVGLGFSPYAIKPEDSPILAQGAPLLIGATRVDRVIPFAQAERLIARSPRGQSYVSTFAPHAAMVRDDPQWREAVARALDTAAGR